MGGREEIAGGGGTLGGPVATCECHRRRVGVWMKAYLLGLLCDKKGKLKVVDSERRIVKLVHVCKKADMFGRSFGKWIFGFCGMLG